METTNCPACGSADIDLEEHPDEDFWRCYDCGATWDGSKKA